MTNLEDLFTTDDPNKVIEIAEDLKEDGIPPKTINKIAKARVINLLNKKRLKYD